jgi:DNA polymerase-3 subunit delta'
MIDFYSLIKDTGAYKTVKGEKESGRLSHAYLLLCADKDNLTEYLKIFAKLILCNATEPCMECRKCKLIDKDAYPDLYLYPKKQEKADKAETISSEDVVSIIEESYLKPIEGDKKIFILSQAQTMNAQAQNKLLKTLEEPPHGVCILIGATSEFPILSTVKSRVKKLEIPPFTSAKLFDALKGELTDEERLLSAIACGDGTVGTAVALYSDDDLKEVTDLVSDILVNMQSSSQVLEYSNKITKSKCDISRFLSVTELLLRDLLAYEQGAEKFVFNPRALESIKGAQGFSTGALLHALEKVGEANKRKKFNANPTMLIEWLLFQILEGKFKWKKL